MRCLPAVAALLLSACLVLPPHATADSGLGRHKKMYAVPVPAHVTIDGKLDDWDLSAQILMYVISETSAMQGARFGLMYDADALYLSGDVRDASPMMNRHNPKANGDWGWDADCCQFRLVLDGSQSYPAKGDTYSPREQNRNDQMAHMTLWHYTDTGEPVLQIQYGMAYDLPKAGYAPFGVIPLDKFEARYRKADDGRGYTFEYRIPWTTLEAMSPPKAGDLVAGTVQFNWSTADGMKTCGAWAYDVMLGQGFTFQNAGCWGKVLFADRGNLPREMVEEGLPPEPLLPLEFEYELPADAEVTLALVEATGLIARSLVSQGKRSAGHNVERWDGLDDTGKPLPAGSYAWKGLTHGPISTKYLFSIANSGRPGHKTDDNTGGWGAEGWPTAVCAVPGGLVLSWHCSESGWGTIKVDLEGRKLWGTKHNALYTATDGERLFVAGDSGYNGQDSVLVFDLRDGCPLAWGNGLPALAPPPGGDAKSNVSSGVAWRGGRLYVSWCARDAIGVYDARSGELLETWSVPGPRMLAARPDGSLAVIGEDREASEARRKALFRPDPVLPVPVGGRVLAVTRDQATPLCVEQLDEPAGIAVDRDGAIYVSNWGRRHDVSVFAPDGKFLRAIGRAGGRPRLGRYDPKGLRRPAGLALDAQDRLWVVENTPVLKRQSVWNRQTGALEKEFFGGANYSTHVWIDPEKPAEAYCEGVLFAIDLAKGTWRPQSILWEGYPVIDTDTPDASGSHYGGFRAVTARSGRQYGWSAANGSTLYIRQGDLYRPLLSLFQSANDNVYIPWPSYPFMNDIQKYPNGWYLWQDGDGDGHVQAGEVSFADKTDSFVGFCWVDKDLNLFSGNGKIYRPTRVDRGGIPAYDFTKPDRLPFAGNNGNLPLMTDSADGCIYRNSPDTDIGYARYSPDGQKLLWGYRGAIGWPRAMDKPPAQPGKLWGPTIQLATAGEFTGIAMYFGTFHVFERKSGLCVAMLFRDQRGGGGLGPDVNACETFTGALLKPKGMDRYFLLSGDQDGRVSEVLGLDTVKPLRGGTYVHTPEAEQKATAALAEYKRLAAKAQRLDIGRGQAGLKQTKGIAKYIDPLRNFAVHAAYDDQRLYLTYDVTAPYELLNAAADPKLIFKGGNLLDVQLAADPAADPARKTPAPGDVRLLISRRRGADGAAKPVAVVYRPKVRAFSGQPTVLTSPTGQEPFDAIEISDQVPLEYTPVAGGFSATAAIPLALLGWAPKPGSQVRMDVGYVFGNAGGTQVTLRAYWSNNSFSANVVNDVPNESRLEPHEWGTASVE